MRAEAIVDVLEQMGFEVEAAHHEVAHGQHEIDFRYADALKTADNIATFRFIVRHVAQQFDHGVVHAEAGVRPERKRNAYSPVAFPRKGKCLLGQKREVGTFANRVALYRRTAEPRTQVLRDHRIRW